MIYRKASNFRPSATRTMPRSDATRITFYEAKPFLLHGLLFLFIFAYAFVGGVIFHKLEAEAVVKVKEEEFKRNLRCVMSVFRNESYKREHSDEIKAYVVTKCWMKEPDDRSKWSYITATLYGFGIITTLGYNRIAPVTQTGRLFCVFYGICGIPLTMIIIANFGRYLNEITKKFKSRCDKSVASSLRRASLHHRIEENRKSSVSKGNDEPSIERSSIGLLIVFLLYISSGAILLPWLNGKIDFINGLYYNFLCLTAIDFGQLVPPNIVYLPITFAYVCVGLAITTIAIDVGSEYLKKLQNIGKRVKNVASVRIWFGGKTLKVRELLHAVGGKCGVESGVIDKLDLDNIVEIAIAINEGREPPNDNNAIQDPCPPYSPRLDPIFPNIETISIASWDEAPLLSIHSFQKFWETLQATDVCETPKFSAEKYSVDPNEPIIYPLNHPEPVNEPSTSEPEPKQFQAKKERYKRDPKKLFEIYQQEWNRIDRLKANKKQENPETKRKNSSQ